MAQCEAYIDMTKEHPKTKYKWDSNGLANFIEKDYASVIPKSRYYL